MGICNDTRVMARTALADRIDMLGRELSHLSHSRIAFAVDDIRREARRSRFETLALLASGLERAMASSGGATIVLPYLEAMGDALACEEATVPPAQQAALLASVGIRLHG